MPSYKTHSVHGDVLSNNSDIKYHINNEDFKSFCMGPDILVLSDYYMFNYQHDNKTKEFFMKLLKLIKEYKLEDNREVMSFLYGHADHLVLDSIMHPFIYYFTEGKESKYLLSMHSIVEHNIDNYVIKKYGINNKNYYKKRKVDSLELKKIIDKLYYDVYGLKYESVKYNMGLLSTIIYDEYIRNSILVNLFNVGDIKYKSNFIDAIKYLNGEHSIWFNPETSEEYNYSFDELWNKSIDVSLEIFNDINNYIYREKSFKNKIILNDISYNTGLPCNMGQTKKYIKK